MLFQRHHPSARFASWSFICLLILFVAIWTQKPAVGLAGIGAVLVMGSMLVLANSRLIWEQYKKSYKKSKNSIAPESWSKPNSLYYRLNVYVVWPLVLVLGLVAIWAAYVAG